MLVVGVTGGIGSGKSTVASHLTRKGARLVDADRIAGRILLRGGLAREPVLERFGPEVLGTDGEIDHRRLAQKVFGDARARRDLESITHPVIREEIRAAVEAARQDGESVVLVEAALLVEARAKDLVDLLVVVTAPREMRVARLLAKGSRTREEIESRMAAQASEATLREAADVVLENDGDRETLERRAGVLWETIRARAAGRNGTTGEEAR